MAVHVTPDGKSIGFVQQRSVGRLFAIRRLRGGR